MTLAQTARVRPAASETYVVGLLFVVYLLNYLDRQIVNILAEPIKRELHLADWQLGLMTGLAFAVFYTFLGIPLARYADRPTANRARLITVCLTIWSGMTAVCGVAGGFLQLLAARIGVGIGEAGCSPAAHSLISDLVPKARRATAMSIYSLGIPLGKLVGMAVGGMVAQALGWRMAFILVGAPGLLLAALTWFTLPEPRQVVSAPPAVKAPPQLALGAMFRGLAPVRTFWWISLGGAFMSFVSYGQTAFMGSFFIRVHGLSVGEAGLMLGLALGAGGALGTWFGGRFADWGARRDRRAYVLIPAAAAALGGVLFAVAVLTPATAPALMILACGGVMNSVWYGPVFATVQGLVPATQRATAAAVHLFIINLIGLGFGPLAFGALSDLLNVGWPGFAGFGPELGLRYALACGSFLAFLALLAFWKASQTIRQELDVQDA